MLINISVLISADGTTFTKTGTINSEKTDLNVLKSKDVAAIVYAARNSLKDSKLVNSIKINVSCDWPI